MFWKKATKDDPLPPIPKYYIGDTVIMKRWRCEYWNMFEVKDGFYREGEWNYHLFSPSMLMTLNIRRYFWATEKEIDETNNGKS